MKEVKGNYGNAIVFTDNVEQMALDQIQKLMDQPFIEGLKVRVMPDCHPGAGCVIGLTHEIKDKVVPSLVGVDIGCGMFYAKVEHVNGWPIDLEKIDQVIREHIPSGFNVRKDRRPNTPLLDKLRCKTINRDRVELSIGSLGGGNHFIEFAKDDEKNLYLVIHSGSRSLGTSIAKHYQGIAVKNQSDLKSKADEVVSRLKAQGREQEIAMTLAEMKRDVRKFDSSFAYLEGQDLDDYLNDVKIAQQYANLNRLEMASVIAEKLDLQFLTINTTVHNYIDTEKMILRKGSVSAREGEELLIPINMRDGSLICVGKGNDDWNQSAPHGAGRLCSRTESKKLTTMEEFEKSMEGIYTTSVSEHTLDESPFAYKPIEEIMENIKDTVDIVKRIIPVYNFKAE